MAQRAALIARIEHVMRIRERRNAVIARAEVVRAVMAAEAQRENHRPLEQLGIGGSMRHVTDAAALHADRRMFIGEGSALIGMAFQASVLIALGARLHARPVCHAPGGRERSVRIVTVGTGHEAFVHAMLEGHGELRAHVRVTRVTKIGLFLCQQELGRGRFVNGMTVRADYVGQRVCRAADIGFCEIAGVAGEAGVQDGLRLHQREGMRNGGFAAARCYVSLPRPVTALASGTLGRQISVGDALIVRVLVKVEPDIGVTSLTYLAADVFIGRDEGQARS